MTTQEIAERLIQLCRQAKWETAQRELFSPNAVSIEPMETPAFAKETIGLDAIVEKGRKFESMIETLHKLTVSDPLVASGSFACLMTMDVTMKGRPRLQMSEVCLYHVKDGKIISEQFHM